MTLHDLFTLLNLLIGTSRHDMTQIHYRHFPGINIEVQYIIYTSEYIPKLQIHQHSLLTRKVFSRHNLSALVFFFVLTRSSRHIHIQFIFIFKSSSSLDLDHHLIQIIITRSRSSLDLDHLGDIIIGFGSSLDLDHHCQIIITGSRSSLDLDHHWVNIIGAIS